MFSCTLVRAYNIVAVSILCAVLVIADFTTLTLKTSGPVSTAVKSDKAVECSIVLCLTHSQSGRKASDISRETRG